MRTVDEQKAHYRGFAIKETTEVIEQSDLEPQKFDFILPPRKIGDIKKKYSIVKIGGDWNRLGDVKRYIDRIMSKEKFDDNIDSPADFFELSYCINTKVTCGVCSYANYGRDCKNNKINNLPDM